MEFTRFIRFITRVLGAAMVAMVAVQSLRVLDAIAVQEVQGLRHQEVLGPDRAGNIFVELSVTWRRECSASDAKGRGDLPEPTWHLEPSTGY